MFWSNLFKKKKYSTNMVNNISSKIPSFEELTPEEQEYVSNLKEEYLKFYENEDNYISLDSELFNEIKMYQDLALDIMHNDHFGNIASSIIDSKKLVYYSHKITELNNTLKYKYIALCELRKAKKYLTKHMGLYVLGRRKINILKALDHQINIINNMSVISNQKITDYCACAIANYPKNIDETTEKKLNDRYIEVEKDYKELFNSSINLDDNLTITDKVTYMEILINKFIYENKDLINKLKEQLDLIANSEIKDETTQQEIIDNLMKIKMYYQIFYKYGRNKLTQQDIEDLYQIVFNVYTYFPLGSNFSKYYNSLENDEEKDFYLKIIESKLNILKFDRPIALLSINENEEKVYNHLINTFKINENFKLISAKNANLEDIINHKLDLLLCLDYIDGFEKYFKIKDIENKNNNKIYILYGNVFSEHFINRKEYYKFVITMHNYYIKHKDYKKLEALSNSLKIVLNEIIYSYKRYYDEIKLYKILNKDKINFNKLPEGLKYTDIYIKMYCETLKEKVVYLPQSITEFIYSEEINKTNCLFIPSDACTEITINVGSYDINGNYYNGKILMPVRNNIKICKKESLFTHNFDKIEKYFENLANHFVIDNKLLNFNQEYIINYLTHIFSFLKDYIGGDDILTVSYKYRVSLYKDLWKNYVYIWRHFFENLLILNKNGNIQKIKLVKNKQLDVNFKSGMSIIGTAYKYVIEELATSLENYKKEVNFKEITGEPKTLIKK